MFAFGKCLISKFCPKLSCMTDLGLPKSKPLKRVILSPEQICFCTAKEYSGKAANSETKLIVPLTSSASCKSDIG